MRTHGRTAEILNPFCRNNPGSAKASRDWRQAVSSGSVPSPTRLCCEQVDLLNNTVTLYSGETKNKEGRIVALTEECRFLVTDLRKGKQPEDFLFIRNGDPVRDFRGTWAMLTKKAGLLGLLLHNFRWSSARKAIVIEAFRKRRRESLGVARQMLYSRGTISSAKRTSVMRPRKIEVGAKAVMHSSFTVEQTEDETQEKGDARKAEESIS